MWIFGDTPSQYFVIISLLLISYSSEIVLQGENVGGGGGGGEEGKEVSIYAPHGAYIGVSYIRLIAMG